MLRLLHTASLALGAPLPNFGHRAGARREDFFRTFDRLVEIARRERVQVFLVAGDLFACSRPDRDCLQRVQAGLQDLVEAGIRPVLLPGAGDGGLTADSVYRRGELPATVLSPWPGLETLEVDGRPIRFVAAPGSPPPALPEGIDIGVVGAAAEPLPGTSAAWHSDYLAVGGRGEFQLLERDGAVCGCRPGAPEGHDFSEPGPRHAALVEVAAGNCRVTALPVASRPLQVHELHLEGGEGEGDLLGRIRAAVEPQAALQLTLRGPVEQPLDLAALEAAAGAESFFLELRDRTRLAASRLVGRLAGEDTVRGLCLRRLLARLAEADAGEQELLEAALREILGRLRIFAEGGEA